MDKVTIRDLYEKLEAMEEKIEKKYVQKNEFLPVKLLVYGAVAIILTRVVGAGVGYIVNQVDFIAIAKAAK